MATMMTFTAKTWRDGSMLCLVTILGAVSTGLCGCAGYNGSAMNAIVTDAKLQGSVYGGQQPINGAAITLYAASNAGYGAATTNLLTSAVMTDANGKFSLSSKFSCTAGQQLYIVATGGDPGSGINASAAEMAALGDCAGIGTGTVISINEVTTVGSVFALAPFMSSYTGVGATAANTSGLTRAFASVKKVVDVSTGSAPGPAVPMGATVPVNEINSLANVLAACINSTGGTGNGTTCGKLFSLATPAGGTAPTDTIAATLAIAQNPTLNPAAIYNIAAGYAAFTPTLGNAPNDWTLSINYATPGLSAPQSTTVDASGKIWIANSGNNSVTVLAQTGVPMSGSPLTGNSLNAPAAIAIDAAGDALIANKGASSISVFTSSGGVFTGSPFMGGGLNNPSAIAIDAAGDIWVANGNSSVSELTGAGASIRQVSSGSTAAAAIAIDPK